MGEEAIALEGGKLALSRECHIGANIWNWSKSLSVLAYCVNDKITKLKVFIIIAWILKIVLTTNPKKDL